MDIISLPIETYSNRPDDPVLVITKMKSTTYQLQTKIKVMDIKSAEVPKPTRVPFHVKTRVEVRIAAQ